MRGGVETIGERGREQGGRIYAGTGGRRPIPVHRPAGEITQALDVLPNDETIGERGRHAHLEPAPVRILMPPPRQIGSPPSHRQRETTTAYIPRIIRPATPDRPSNLPFGRHDREYIESQKETPLEILGEKIEGYIGRHHLPEEPEAQELARRQAAITTILDPEPPAARQTEEPARETPRTTLRPPRQRNPHRFRVAHAEDQTAVDSDLDETKSTDALPSATEPETPAKPRSHGRLRRTVAAVAATIVGSITVTGAIALFRNDTLGETQPANNTKTESVLPEVPKSLEVPQTAISETDTISVQDGDGWGHSANKTQTTLDGNYLLTGTINIVKDLGSYDSRHINPDPDDAKPGDKMITPTKTTIVELYRLQQPLGPNASQTEIDAAQIIHKLNNLGPMETKALIDQYGDEIEALKEKITQILNPYQKNQTSYSPKHRMNDSDTHASFTKPKPEKETTVVSETAPSTIFSGITSRLGKHFRPKINSEKAEALARGRKAIAELASEQASRQKQSYV